MTKLKHTKQQSERCRLAFVPKTVAVLGFLWVTGCTAGNAHFSDLGHSWFVDDADQTSEITTDLPRDPGMLANGDDVKTAIYNATQLANQKRFEEARYLLTSVRELQNPEDEGYQALTCSMALLALRAGDIRTFKRTARQLDLALKEPVHVDPAYVGVISLYRMLVDRNLPVNAPAGIKRLANQLS